MSENHVVIEWKTGKPDKSTGDTSFNAPPNLPNAVLLPEAIYTSIPISKEFAVK
jgi:hypothetical protein